jgi:hypothetical protein
MNKIDKIIKGLQLLQAYGAHTVEAQHDVIFAGVNDNIFISEKDKQKLISWGWHYSTEYNCWQIFT